MVLGTKERITAHRLFSTERFIRSTLPVLYISGRRDFQGTNQFLSDDAYGHLCTRTGALWTPQGYSFDGVDDKITIPDHSSLQFGIGNFTISIWAKNTGEQTLERLIQKWTSGSHRIVIAFQNTVNSPPFYAIADGAGNSASLAGTTPTVNLCKMLSLSVDKAS